ncbi:MAG: protein-L-isoaspartate(D-aspartate) O-methyltransferase [Saprospiraceae bacterium]|nr:protein-L-isoaspartate(D-aspartate) O-methyltransferase [Saprospiraceae bacterium]
MEDNNRHKGMRNRLVKSLNTKGIRDTKVLDAIQNIPRHFFLDKAFEEHAYEDKAFPIDQQQTISQPYTVAFQTELLNINKRDKVLEIGTGSGYQSAVLAFLGARVYTVERHKLLYENAVKMFQKLNFMGIRAFFADGNKGLGEFAPFDKILVTAGAKQLPFALKEQLKIGGVLVIPVGDESSQTMLRITRVSQTEFKEDAFGKFRFVPLLKGKNSLLDI